MRSFSVEPLFSPPAASSQAVELARLDVAGAHEHQVLEQVREPGPARALARRADVVPDVDGDDRDAVILVQDHVQPVGQRELRVRHFERPWRCAARGGADCAAAGAVSPSARSSTTQASSGRFYFVLSLVMKYAACQSRVRSSASSWAASRTGRRCARPTRC